MTSKMVHQDFKLFMCTLISVLENFLDRKKQWKYSICTFVDGDGQKLVMINLKSMRNMDFQRIIFICLTFIPKIAQNSHLTITDILYHISIYFLY